MGTLSFISLLFVTFFAFTTAQQSCTAVDFVANFIVGNETIFQWNATLVADTTEGITRLSIENEASHSKNDSKYHLLEHSDLKASINGQPGKVCGATKEACSWAATNATLNLFLPVSIDGKSGEEEIFEGVVDEGTISLAWGPILQEGNKCNQDGEENGALPNVQVQIQQCCSKFVDAKPPPSSVPTCNLFRSRSIIHNPDFSIYATVNTTIKPDMMSLDVTSDYTGPSGSKMDVSANGYYTMCMTHTDTTSSCSFPLVMGDSKYLFLLQIHGDDWSYPLSAGRLVIRNKELLMEEGTGFTKNNDCFYSSVTYDDGKMGTTSICCKEFA